MQDAKGRSVMVPAVPERVVALTEPSLDGLVALGVEPAGASSGRGQATVAGYLEPYAAGVPIVAALAAPNLEQIAALEPDLILIDGTSSSDDVLLDKLDGIAPTVYLAPTAPDWKEAFLTLGDTLGMTVEAEQVLADYDAKIAEVRDAIGPRLDDTVSIVRWGLVGPSVILQELPPGQVLQDIGLARPPAQDREGLGHSEPVSLENIDQIDADWMFFGTLGGASGPTTADQGGGEVGAAGSADTLQAAVAAPGFTDLEAYRNGRVIPVDGSAWTSAGGPIAAGIIVDDIRNALGNP